MVSCLLIAKNPWWSASRQLEAWQIPIDMHIECGSIKVRGNIPVRTIIPWIVQSMKYKWTSMSDSITLGCYVRGSAVVQSPSVSPPYRMEFTDAERIIRILDVRVEVCHSVCTSLDFGLRMVDVVYNASPRDDKYVNNSYIKRATLPVNTTPPWTQTHPHMKSAKSRFTPGARSE